MNFKVLSDQNIQESLRQAVHSERKLTAQILEMLKEVSDRRLFAKRGYSSLHSYCTEYLGYSEGAAHRRISSMRLMKEVPDLKRKIEDGKVNLSTLSKAATFFHQEKKMNHIEYSTCEKAQVLEIIEGKSQKEAERCLVEISPKAFSEKVHERPLSGEFTEIKFSIDSETLEQLERLKELKPGMNTKELFHWMLTRNLRQIDPARKSRNLKNATKEKTSVRIDHNKKSNSQKIQKTSSPESEMTSLPLKDQKSPQTRPLREFIGQSKRYQVWQNAGASCQYFDSKSGKKCHCRKGLEIDHIRPLSFGGSNEISNLRLLCKEHHRLVTVKSFGEYKQMKKCKHLHSGGSAI